MKKAEAKRLQDILVNRSLARATGCEKNLAEGHWWKGMTGQAKITDLKPPIRNINGRYIGPDLHGAYTMLGTKRLDNMVKLLQDLDRRKVPGAVLEAGVWRGGNLVWIAKHTDRKVYGADSFQGCPKPTWYQDVFNAYFTLPFLAVSQSEVQANLQKFGVEKQVTLVPGWVKDTMPSLKDVQWAMLRLDLDMYGGTMEVLEALYPQLAPGGYVVMDDFGPVAEVRCAVNDFRQKHGIKTRLKMTDHTEAVWRKP